MKQQRIIRAPPPVRSDATDQADLDGGHIQKRFKEFLLNAPDLSGVDLTRDPSPMRDVELSLDTLPDCRL
jgi:hypothetical protein